jgi:pyruvate/2-oxoglutarate dehydrogenase complex dihydrolipoamide dehydrogenase (E3) component
MDVGDDLAVGTVAAALIVLGGGYVGCEFASMFALFGTQVTLLQGPDQLLPREDSDVAAEVADNRGPSPGPRTQRGSRQNSRFSHSEGQDTSRHDGHMEGGRGRRHRPSPFNRSRAKELGMR